MPQYQSGQMGGAVNALPSGLQWFKSILRHLWPRSSTVEPSAVGCE